MASSGAVPCGRRRFAFSYTALSTLDVLESPTPHRRSLALICIVSVEPVEPVERGTRFELPEKLIHQGKIVRGEIPSFAMFVARAQRGA